MRYPSKRKFDWQLDETGLFCEEGDRIYRLVYHDRLVEDGCEYCGYQVIVMRPDWTDHVRIPIVGDYFLGGKRRLKEVFDECNKAHDVIDEFAYDQWLSPD
jgi:hypothetical protein